MWFEELPLQCPPADAKTPSGTFYRLAENSTATCKDFWSHRKLYPNRSFNTTECIARSVSIFNSKTSLEKLKKLSLHKDKTIVAINLNESAGVLKKTGQDESHFSWWRLSSFNPLEHVITGLQE